MEGLWISLLHLRDRLEHGGRSQYALVDVVSSLHHFVEFLSDAISMLEGREGMHAVNDSCQQHITSLCHTCAEIAQFCDSAHPVLCAFVSRWRCFNTR